jgi:hypothetical protein
LPASFPQYFPGRLNYRDKHQRDFERAQRNRPNPNSGHFLHFNWQDGTFIAMRAARYK